MPNDHYFTFLEFTVIWLVYAFVMKLREDVRTLLMYKTFLPSGGLI